MRMVRDAEAERKEAEGRAATDEAAAKGGAEARACAEGPFISGGGDGGGWKYAVCLTKSDKGGPKAIERVERAVRTAAEEEGWLQPLEIVATSSKTKAGRAAMWRLMRCLVLPG